MRNFFLLIVYTLVVYPMLAVGQNIGIRISAEKCYVGLPVNITIGTSKRSCNKLEVVCNNGKLEKKMAVVGR